MTRIVYVVASRIPNGGFRFIGESGRITNELSMAFRYSKIDHAEWYIRKNCNDGDWEPLAVAHDCIRAVVSIPQ